MTLAAHPLDQPAAQLAALIGGRQISAEAVVAESLRRAEAVTERLNCFTVIRHDQALTAARRLDAGLAAGAPAGALAGVPFAAKDLTPTQGDLTTRGSWTTGDWVPGASALVVRRLEAAGAILIGKTTSPEFAHSSLTASPRWGITRNPWNIERSSGGSSGGSAVAVASHVVPFAEGTDMGGSVRIPAAFCGIVGLKPSLGRIPMTILPSQFDNISHFGPLARRVEDAVAFMAATAGPSDEDISSLPLSFDAAAAGPGGLAGKRLAFSLDLGYFAVQPEVERVVRRALAVLEAAGATVIEVALPWTRAVTDQWFDLWCVFMSAYFGDSLAAYRDRMDPLMVTMMERGFSLDATAYKRIELLRTVIWQDLAALLAGVDALLCPTCAIVAPPVSHTDDDYMATLPDGRLAGLDMTCAFNLVGQCPALSLPAGLSADGLPVGLQMVGRRYADEALLALAGAAERALRDAGTPTTPATPCVG